MELSSKIDKLVASIVQFEGGQQFLQDSLPTLHFRSSLFLFHHDRDLLYTDLSTVVDQRSYGDFS